MSNNIICIMVGYTLHVYDSVQPSVRDKQVLINSPMLQIAGEILFRPFCYISHDKKRHLCAAESGRSPGLAWS